MAARAIQSSHQAHAEMSFQERSPRRLKKTHTQMYVYMMYKKEILPGLVKRNG